MARSRILFLLSAGPLNRTKNSCLENRISMARALHTMPSSTRTLRNGLALGGACGVSRGLWRDRLTVVVDESDLVVAHEPVNVSIASRALEKSILDRFRTSCSLLAPSRVPRARLPGSLSILHDLDGHRLVSKAEQSIANFQERKTRTSVSIRLLGLLILAVSVLFVVETNRGYRA